MPEIEYDPLQVEVGVEDESDGDTATLTESSGVFVTSSDWTTETLVSQLRKDNINLSPDFQRRDVWTPTRKSSLIESVILNLPIPQIVLAERLDARGKFLVLDGKQRLLALRQFCSDPTLETDVSFEPLVLRGLAIAKDLNGSTFQDLVDDPTRGDTVDAFNNHTIRSVVIRNWPSESYLHAVFHRLNSGSVPLNVQELRQALHPGPFTDVVEGYAERENAIRKALRIQRPDYRMRDNEMLLRFLAFGMGLHDYRGNLKGFLDSTWQSLNQHWSTYESRVTEEIRKCEEAVDAAISIFTPRSVFCSYNPESQSFERRFNRAIFDIVTYFLREEEPRRLSVERAQEVRDAFIAVSCEDSNFLQYVTTTTKSITAVKGRFGVWGSALGAVINQTVQSPFDN